MATSFETYLTREQLATSSIREHLATLERFRLWTQKEQLDEEQLNYRDLLAWVQQAQKRGLKKQTLNQQLGSLTKYYNHLIEAGARADNPAKKLRIKTEKRTLQYDLFKPEELDELYQAYKTRNHQGRPSDKQAHNRGKIILSLTIHQAIRPPELRNLEAQDINYDKGEIYLPGTKRSNSRTVKLHPGQIMPLYEFTNGKSGQLIEGRINDHCQRLQKQLTKHSEKFTSLQQIRASVITHWIKQHGLREAQYKAGHKHISSTEHYRHYDIESLQNALNKYHPLS